MTHDEAVKEKFKEEADKVLTYYKPIIPTGVKLNLDVKKHEERKKELADEIMGIHAPDINDDTKEEIVEWAKSELDKYMANAIKEQ
ncbi:MAG: hypothetical protein EOP51_09710 [Sphingobacteriales bacterium]|nr:MAG: hypothetical protein EOP51_09710 [Sphingobacteriales bacterium]